MKSKHGVTDLNGSGRNNTDVLLGMSGATENHEPRRDRSCRVMYSNTSQYTFRALPLRQPVWWNDIRNQLAANYIQELPTSYRSVQYSLSPLACPLHQQHKSEKMQSTLTPSPCFMPFCFSVPFQITPLHNLRSLLV